MGWQYCAAWVAALGLGSACGFGAPEGTDGTDTADGGGDGGDGAELVVIDTRRSDFAGATHADTTLIALGTEDDPDVAIEPVAYAVGGLRARLWDTTDARNNFDATTPFEAIGTATALADRLRGTGYRFQPRLDGDSLKRGLGHAADSDFLVVFEGEIQLAAMDQQIIVGADDRLRVEVQLDGETWISAYDVSSLGDGTLVLGAFTPGWYPVRMAFEEEGGLELLRVLLGPAGNELPLDPRRLRSRLSDERGLLVHGYSTRFEPLDTVGIAAAPDLDNDYGDTEPYRLATGTSNYTLRYVGQIWIDVAGEYTFGATLEQRDQYRVWIDDALVARRWDLDPVPVAQPTTLTAGWHDLLVDFRQSQNLAAFSVLWQPPGATEPTGIPPERLRPVATGGRYAWTVRATDLPIDTNPIIMSDLTVAPDARLQFLDTYFVTKGRSEGSLTARLRECAMETDVPLTLTPAGDEQQVFAHDRTCAGMPLPALELLLTEVDASQHGDIAAFTTVATYTGGASTDAPFLPASRLVSRVHAVPAGRRLARVTAQGALAGATVDLAVRTAANETDLAAALWQPVDPATGAVPAALPAGAVAQYQITLRSDGWQRPVIDSVSLGYALE